MSITQLTRFKSTNSEEMIKGGKQAKPLFEKHRPDGSGSAASTPAEGNNRIEPASLRSKRA